MLDHFKLHITNIFVGLVLFPISILVFFPFVLLSILLYIYHMLRSIHSYDSAFFFRNYSKNLAVAVDQYANTVIYGNADQTISGRMGIFIYIKKKNHILITLLCKFLDFFFKDENHCKEAIEYDRINNYEKKYRR